MIERFSREVAINIEQFGRVPALADRAKCLEGGGYFLLRDFALKAATLDRIRGGLLEGIGRLHGTRCRDAVARDGLGQIHKHFPIQKVPELPRSSLAPL